jgi:hypothetical protein
MIKTIIAAMNRYPKILLVAGTLLPWVWSVAFFPLWASLVSLAATILSAAVLGLLLNRNGGGFSGNQQVAQANVGDDLSALLPRWSGMAHKTHSELHDVRNQIHGVMQQTEQAVLNISGCFRNITDKTNAQMKYATSLLQSTHGLEPQTDSVLPYYIDASDTTLNAVADEIARFSELSLNIAANQDNVKAMMNTADGLLNKMDLMIRQIMAISASQKRLTPIAISERIGALSGNGDEINKLNIRMREHLQIIQQGLNGAYADIHNLADDAMSVATTIKSNVIKLTESAVKKNQEVVDVINHINALGEEVRQDIYKIIVDLQFQDITHQKLERVKTPLLNELGQGLRAIAEETHILYQKLRRRFIGKPARSRSKEMHVLKSVPQNKVTKNAADVNPMSLSQSSIDNKVELF